MESQRTGTGSTHGSQVKATVLHVNTTAELIAQIQQQHTITRLDHAGGRIGIKIGNAARLICGDKGVGIFQLGITTGIHLADIVIRIHINEPGGHIATDIYATLRSVLAAGYRF